MNITCEAARVRIKQGAVGEALRSLGAEVGRGGGRRNEGSAQMRMVKMRARMNGLLLLVAVRGIFVVFI